MALVCVGDFPLKIPFEKCFKIVFFVAVAPRSGFGAPVSGAVPRSVFCISVAADRIVMAASRFLAAVAACVMRLAFAAQSRESYGSGRIKVAKVICQQIS